MDILNLDDKTVSPAGMNLEVFVEIGLKSIMNKIMTTVIPAISGCLLLIVSSQAVPNQQSRQNKSTASTESSTDSQQAAIKLQILLDRAKFSTGEIDGRIGTNVQKALAAFQESRGISQTDTPDDATWEALGASVVDTLITTYTITAEDTAGPFTPGIPEDPMEQAKLSHLGYISPLELLGEKFHCSPDLLKQLDPDAEFKAGDQIQVPNVLTDTSATQRPNPQKQRTGKQENPFEGRVLIVNQDNSDVVLRSANGEVLFYAPATVGSKLDPLPVGTWKITVVRKDPVFYYHPELFWDAEPTDSKAKIAPGPNNPVGVVWIGVNAPHYGLHGTPEPGLIGHSESHGCIRLTNWDALRLAALVKPGTTVIFQ